MIILHFKTSGDYICFVPQDGLLPSVPTLYFHDVNFRYTRVYYLSFSILMYRRKQQKKLTKWSIYHSINLLLFERDKIHYRS